MTTEDFAGSSYHLDILAKVKSTGDDADEGHGSTSRLTPCKKDKEKETTVPSHNLLKNSGPIHELRINVKQILEDKGGLEVWSTKFKAIHFFKGNMEETIGAIVGAIFEKAIQCQTDPCITTDCAIIMLELYQSHPNAYNEILNQCVTEFKKGIMNKNVEEFPQTSLAPPSNLIRRRYLGTCQLFAELYQGVGMLTPKIMMESLVMLLGTEDDASLECLSILLRSIGQKLETDIGILCASGMTSHPDGDWIPDSKFMDKAFMKLKGIAGRVHYSSRIQESLMDVYSLRKNGWKSGIGGANKSMAEVPKPSMSDPQTQAQSFLPLSSENVEDFDLTLTVRKVLVGYLHTKKVNFNFIMSRYPGNEIIQFSEELACQVCGMENEDEQMAAGDLVRNVMEKQLISKAEIIQSLLLGVEMLQSMKAYAAKGVMAFATFLAQLFGQEKDLCWLAELGNLVKGKVSEEDWKGIVTCTMYKLTLKVGAAETFVQNLVANTPGASDLPISLPSEKNKSNLPGTSASASSSKLQSPQSSAPLSPPTPRIPYHPLANPPTPPNWEVALHAAVKNLTPFMRVPVATNTQEHTVLSALLQPYLRITNLDRIVNPELWRRFCNTRRDMLSAKSDDMELLAALGISETEIRQRAHILANWRKEPAIAASPYSDNMVLLFHGTRTKLLDDIFGQGLDERLGNGGSFGKGIYFADNPTKSMSYDANNTLLIFAVMLGDCINISHSSHRGSHVREPQKIPSQKRNPTDLFFDSLVGNPGQMSEYVIFNRYQCCPLYAVNYTRGHGGTQPASPPFVWSTHPPPGGVTWQLHARNVFGGMEEDERSQAPGCRLSKSCAPKPPPSKDSIALMLSQLQDLGFRDDTVSMTLLEIYDYNLEETIDSLLEGASAAMSFNPSLPSGTNENVHTIGINGFVSKLPEGVFPPASLKPQGPIAKKNIGIQGKLQAEDEEDGECLVCFTKVEPEAAESSTSKKLKCGHHLCMDCYHKIQSTGTTMSGVSHKFMKCPFCLAATGVEIGSCPNGTMTVTEIPNVAAGYEGYTTLCIQYFVTVPPGLNRIAYVPNSPEGKKVVDLLRKAWDRRLCFSIGTSMTTGKKNVLVWNIHHKSALRGGVQCHGYPDPTYLTRVQAELAQYSIM